MRSFEPGAPKIPAPSEPGLAPAPRRRPFGLYAILILLSMQALLSVMAVALISLGLTVAAADIWAMVAPKGALLLESLGIMLAVAVVVVGLWRYRLWAWYGMMLLLAYWMATDAIGYFRGAPRLPLDGAQCGHGLLPQPARGERSVRGATAAGWSKRMNDLDLLRRYEPAIHYYAGRDVLPLCGGRLSAENQPLAGR